MRSYYEVQVDRPEGELLGRAKVRSSYLPRKGDVVQNQNLLGTRDNHYGGFTQVVSVQHQLRVRKPGLIESIVGFIARRKPVRYESVPLVILKEPFVDQK